MTKKIAYLMMGLLPISVMGYGLGNIKVHSSINEPLDAEIPLTDIRRSELSTLKLQLLTELQKPVKKADKKYFSAIRPMMGEARLKASILTKNGLPFIHVTSEQPLYTNCNKILFKCYQFYRFGISADWGKQYWHTNVKRNYSIIPVLDDALGAIELNSAVGQKLNLDIQLLKDISSLKNLTIGLAPREAWVRGLDFGDREYKLAKELGIHFTLIDGKVRVISRHHVDRSFSNPIQTAHAPLVLLLEAIWTKGRELKKYTIYLPS